MRRSEVALHYAEFKNKNTGRIYRLLSTNLPNLIPGHLSSDAFGFFGLGSGERDTRRIQNLPLVKAIPLGDLDLVSAILYWKDKPNYVGFIDPRPQSEPVILLDGNEHSFHDLPINWEVYGRLGEPIHAQELLGSFARIHAAYPKHEQHRIRCEQFMNYVKLTAPQPW
jgi:hypothetical protein